MLPIRQISAKRPFDDQLLGFLNSLAYFGQLWWDRHLACLSNNDRQDAKISRPEIRLGNYSSLVRRGSRTARNEGAGSGAPTPRIFPQAILRHFQVPVPPTQWSRILLHLLQSENASPELRIETSTHS